MQLTEREGNRLVLSKPLTQVMQALVVDGVRKPVAGKPERAKL